MPGPSAPPTWGAVVACTPGELGIPPPATPMGGDGGGQTARPRRVRGRRPRRVDAAIRAAGARRG
eukprot:3101208-Pleurochrysis_carterae.AAC.1